MNHVNIIATIMAKSSIENEMDTVNNVNTTNDDDSPMNEMSAVEKDEDEVDTKDVPMEEDENDTNNNSTNDDKGEEEAGDDDENDDDVASNAASEKEDEEENKEVDEAYKPSNDNDGAPTKKRRVSDAPATTTNDDDNNEPLPTLPLKKARTAYFIFAQDKREELKQKYQGEGVAALSKATGELWKGLEQADKEVYERQAAQEREKYMKDKQRLIDAGFWPESSSGGADAGEYDEEAILFPIGRIRKICKLDSDVKGMSKEATLLVAKATELFASKLGSEVVTMAQMSNRRKLLPDDVVEVCSVKERFMFLKDDLQDLVNEQKEVQKEKENEKASSGSKSDKSVGAASSLLSYFGKVHND
mmetsp:Transcript_7028/g.11466  ORF Transcript_7028/g.11466 Transcript_7028/m.11466 type:complete len:360 (+) Transcript_7028:1-1080(+)